jgi:DNA-binding CsgD family transcriptional regulator
MTATQPPQPGRARRATHRPRDAERHGIAGFADRAARELRATGATVRNRAAETTGGLTPQETQIARLTAEGLSNPEIGTRLFLSPRHVEYHLGKIFAKLGIRTRRELAHVVGLVAP